MAADPTTPDPRGGSGRSTALAVAGLLLCSWLAHVAGSQALSATRWTSVGVAAALALIPAAFLVLSRPRGARLDGWVVVAILLLVACLYWCHRVGRWDGWDAATRALTNKSPARIGFSVEWIAPAVVLAAGIVAVTGLRRPRT